MYQLFSALRERLDARMIVLSASGVHAKFHEDPDVETVGPLVFPRGIADLRRAIRARARSFDVLHVYDVYYGMPAAYLARASPRVVCFGSDPILEMRGRYGFLGGLAVGLSLPVMLRDAHLVTNSRDLAQRFPHFRPDFIPNGVAVPERILPREEARAILGLAQDRPILVYVGKVIPVKRLEWLLEAVRRLPEVRSVIVGDVNEEHYGDRYYRSLISTYADVMNRVQFTGEVTWERVSTYLAAADVFVFPSSFEGMPNAVMEAMAAALPVVASDIPAHRELLQEGSTGLLASDVPTLVRHVETLLADPELRRRIGENARRYVATNLSVESSAERYRRLYERMVAPAS
jgi:glycosyltransferase involved in cell wall biosynthesis